MTDVQGQVPLVILIVGSTIVAAVFVKVGLERLRIPVLIGYIGLGALIRLADSHLGFLQDQGRELFHVLERIGVICMLFRVGLESKLGGLMRQLRRATHVWLISIAVCGVFGYGACALVLGLPHIPSLFVGVALTATSVGMRSHRFSASPRRVRSSLTLFSRLSSTSHRRAGRRSILPPRRNPQRAGPSGRRGGGGRTA